MPTRRRLLPGYRHLLTSDSLTAIINLSADLEFFLSTKLFFEKHVPLEKMERWTLGKLVDECIKVDFVNNNRIGLLKDFVELRNRALHWRGILNDIRQNPVAELRLEKMLTEVYDFVEKAEIIYQSDWELEREYGNPFVRQKAWI